MINGMLEKIWGKRDSLTRKEFCFKQAYISCIDLVFVQILITNVFLALLSHLEAFGKG